LIALAIVAVLAQTVLRAYGLLPGPEAAERAGPRAVGAVAPAPPDATTAVPAPTAPIERARGVERELRRDADAESRRIDEQTK
jgi:hypothetical protein